MPRLPRTNRLALFSGLLCALGLVLLLLWPRPSQAQSSVPDASCRGCHGDNQRFLTFPSSETLALLVDLPTLDASAHNFANTSPVSCTDCHTGRARYRYPHQANPAHDRHAFSVAVAQNCQNCHYPHNPFHEQKEDASQPTQPLPTCVDCHGSHQVDRVENALNSIPANCVTCHTDQPQTWATDLLAPRPGLGEGASGYAGSTRCIACHAEQYLTWRQTMHAKTVQPASQANAIVADFSQDDPNRSFGLDQVAFTLGGRLKQQFLTATVDGNLFVLPAQWSVAKQEWLTDPAGQTANEDWRQNCSGCHVTGLVTTTWQFTEFGVGCESCHGPSEDHIADPKNVKPLTGQAFAAVDDQVCGACHSRGTSPEGLPFPASYHPGDTLTDHFTPSQDPNHLWPDGSAKMNNQQYTDWQLGSRMAQAESTSCVSCHAVHGEGAAPVLLKAPVATLCLECHHDKHELLQHTPYHQQASAKRQFTCLDCHMPKLATLAEPYDIHNHSFLQPNPQASIDHGGVDKMPNACNLCHTEPTEDAQWAAQTIAYVKTLGVGKKSAAVPGPTLTPPPPPTPLPSVGQPAEIYYVDTAGWLRTTFFVVIGIILIGVAFGLLRARLARRVINA